MSSESYIPRSGAGLARWVRDARESSFALLEGLSDEQLLGERLEIVNPLLWEIGHVAWFQERWLLRHALGQAAHYADGDRWWDSAEVTHHTRWDLDLPSCGETFAYVRSVRDRVLEFLEGGDPDPEQRYFVLLGVFHEDMHTSAFTYTRQTLSYASPPGWSQEVETPAGLTRAQGDVDIPGGSFQLGADPEADFVFDNEKWAHTVTIAPFSIARTAVSQAQYLEFVEDAGYSRDELWCAEGRSWRDRAQARAPVYWRRDGSGWQRRRFDRWIPLEEDLPVLHVNWFEAQAYCRWAGRRLPTEAEWELAASGEPGTDAGIAPTRRRFPWGESEPDATRAGLDWSGGGPASVHAHPEGDSAFGCRQMLGNAWEWTASTFEPYPGFEKDPYEQYSAPWFHTQKVLRGGAWVTRARLLRNTWRNYYEPQRNDVWAGFRTCAP